MLENRVTNTDYFPRLAMITDEHNEISADMVNNKGKPLDESLAKKFKLSRPTIQSLLSTWEAEGRIEMFRDFTGHINKIRILNPYHHRKTNNKVLIVIDWLNIYMNLSPIKLPSLTDLDRVQKQIAQEVGEIVNVFVFAPPHLTSLEWETFYEEGFYIIDCRSIKTKDGKDKDTTDEILINFVKDMVARMSDITHICLGSGDKDFCKALRKTMRAGLQLMIIAGDLNSLSQDLIDVADVNPLTGKKMAYVITQSK